MTPSVRRPYRLLTKVLLALVMALTLLPASGFGESLRNYKIKAGFTYRFILFSEWPETAFVAHPSEFVIGIVGQSPYNGFFDQVVNTPVDGRKLVVRQLSDSLRAEELRECQVVFIHDAHVGELKSILRKLAGAPVLTISDSADFLEEGGMISFFYRRNRIRFSVHRGRANAVGLHFRAQMLKMATHVVEGE